MPKVRTGRRDIGSHSVPVQKSHKSERREGREWVREVGVRRGADIEKADQNGGQSMSRWGREADPQESRPDGGVL